MEDSGARNRARQERHDLASARRRVPVAGTSLRARLRPGTLPMRWLITGGCGFIGTGLIRSLVAEGGHRIRVVDNFAGGARRNLARIAEFAEVTTATLRPLDREARAGLELIEGDVVDGPLMFKAAAGAEVMVHLAARAGAGPSMDDPALDCTVSVFGTLNALEAARHNRVPRFVFASGAMPTGDDDPPDGEEPVVRPVSPFDAGKLAGEGYCSAYYWSFGMDTVVLRFGSVYGPGAGERCGVVASFIRDALAGRPIEIRGDGQQTCDFLFIDDLVRAIRAAAARDGIGGETFRIATSAETSIGELVEKLARALAEAGIPAPAVRNAAPQVGDICRRRPDTGKARELLGWQAQVTLSEGLRRTVAWFVEEARRRAAPAA